jgi:hypothetical protein
MLRSWCMESNRLIFLLILFVSLTGCVTTSERVTPFQTTSHEKPSGFFDRLVDNFSERQCNVGRFTCSFGLGSAGEPCECVGPNNVVYDGYTVK